MAAGYLILGLKKKLHLRKENGLMKDVFEHQPMKEIIGNIRLSHLT
jgi:glutamine phosphoribosylpyrophosphate amidotransferase